MALQYAWLCALPLLLATPLQGFFWDARSSELANAMRYATLSAVGFVLRFFYTGVTADPASGVTGTPHFQITILGPCSGIEGLALVAAVSAGWILWHRREIRIERALLLVPGALAAIWVLNVVRLAALIAIGSAGYPNVAMGGFHTEAGWISFNLVAIGFALLCNRFAWRASAMPASVHLSVSGEMAAKSTASPTAAYLLPFLGVIAASLMTHAASSSFEWLYPLRLVAALAVLWVYRRAYCAVDWRFGWIGVTAGAAVFALWIALSRGIPETASAGTALGLAQLTAGERGAWIAARVVAAAITAPIVEELAFRGFLARRIVAQDFERVEMRNLSWTAVLVSSVVFGLMHGRLWLAGMLAGVVFALVAKFRNRLGEAVAAHATANLLLAAWVLARGDYRLW